MEILKENVRKLSDNKYINLYELEYEKGKVYYDASRRQKDDLLAVKTDEEYKATLPDAVTIFPILRTNDEYKLLLSYEYRYPVGRFLLSPPAGLIDKKDISSENDPVIITAKRELFEETGITVTDNDKIIKISHLLTSTPGMSDESNALVAVIIDKFDDCALSQDNAEGTELFNGFELVSKDDARILLKNGTDKYGNFYSMYTWASLTYFISDIWKD